MSERLAFIQACLDRREKVVAICRRFGISEKTGQKWLARFRVDGEAGLADRSHAPHRRAHRLEATVAAHIVALRRKHPLYGPAKLRDWLVQHEPTQHWPAVSTIGELLKRAGLIRSRRRSRSGERARFASGRTLATAPNVVWTADFKGQFRLGTGRYCYPLTVLDLQSHFLLGCTALPTTAVGATRANFVRLFSEYGLPEVLRTDNGVPFAQPNAIGRFGALAFWWVRLGIRPEHIRPATPAENGAHERFHKTLKAHATRPASRPYPAKLPPLLYPEAMAVRHVDHSGNIKWRNDHLFLSSNLAGEDVGLSDAGDDAIRIHYAALILGDFDPHTERFTPHLRWDSDLTPGTT